MGKVEWVMLELNGELVKPQHDNAVRNTTEAEENDNDKKKRFEFGSVQFDNSVSLDACAVSTPAAFVILKFHFHVPMYLDHLHTGCTYPNHRKS